VLIVAALPDPVGTDRSHELITLVNIIAAAIDLTGWALADAAAGRQQLRGPLAAGGVMQVTAEGGLQLGNQGDTIVLVDPGGGSIRSLIRPTRSAPTAPYALAADKTPDDGRRITSVADGRLCGDPETWAPREITIAMTRLAGLLGDVRAATAFRYDAHDSVGNRMDTAKVIPSPAGGYLAVYHDHEVCHLATSTDLMIWTHRAVIDEPATQPTITSTGDGGLLTAVEFNDGHGGQLRVRYWPTLEALLAGRPAREFLAPRTLSACNEGTPSFRRISLDTDLDSSRIELGFHYHRNCRVDRQALGTLTGFRAWTAARHPELDAAVERAAAAVGEQVRGNIGDRDHLRYRGRDYDLIEAQRRRGDFATWRIYLYDRATGNAERLAVMTHGGSTAFANPTATMLRDPAGRDALMVTMFLPMEGAAPGEAGSLLYLVPIGQAGPAASPSPAVSPP
jgi:hypothetical protein